MLCTCEANKDILLHKHKKSRGRTRESYTCIHTNAYHIYVYFSFYVYMLKLMRFLDAENICQSVLSTLIPSITYSGYNMLNLFSALALTWMFSLPWSEPWYSNTLHYVFSPQSTYSNYYIALYYLILLYFNCSVKELDWTELNLKEGQGNKYKSNCNSNSPVNKFSYIISLFIFPFIWTACSYIWLFIFNINLFILIGG